MANLLKRHEFWLGMFIIALCLLLGWRSEEFFTFGNLYDLANNYAMLTILACGLFVVLIAGGIDISFPAMTIIAQYGMVVMLQKVGGNFAVAFVLAGGGAAMIIGLCNGILIAGIRVSPILATLGMMTLLKGINILITGGSAIANYPQWVLWLNHAQWFGIPLPMWLFAVVAAGLWVLLEKSPLGRAIMLIGSNERATHYSGINTRRVLMWVYVISALLCAVAAFLMMSKLNSAKASYGESYLLVSILAAVLGGVNPDGGSGRIVGMVLALFLLQIIESGFNILGISPYLTMALWGVLLLCFIQARGMLGLERAG
ncbi:ABC transporter permease [Klebsiella pneumoniae]|uniref:ABC transporter permease n=1 Tax=Klebsiella pneumoniae TaxID=573 RepID=UPI003CC919A1